MRGTSAGKSDLDPMQQLRESLQHLMHGHTQADEIRFDESKAEGLYALGHAQYIQGHYFEAMKYFSFILTYDPYNYRAMQAQAACMQMLGKFGQALLLLQVLLVAQEDNKETSLQIIHCLIHLGRSSEAMQVINAIEAALDKAPEDGSSRQRLNGYRQIAQRSLALSQSRPS